MSRSRIRAVFALTAVVGAACPALFSEAASAGPPAAQVSFTSEPATAQLVDHYVVHPVPKGPKGAAPAAPAGHDAERPHLTPKPMGKGPIGSGPNSDGTVAGPNGLEGTPKPAASFIGQQGSSVTCSYFAHGCNPPDMALAASPSKVLQGVNTQWEVLSPTGQVQPGWPVSAQSFFGVPNVTNADGTPCDVASGSQPFMSDPRALYDPADGRFWAAMLQAEGALGAAPDCPFKSVYYIAVSQTGDPSGAWNVYEFEMSDGAPFGADFTQIGFNSDAVFFSANMFANSGNGFYAELFEANKSQMEQGRAKFTADGFRNLQGAGPGIALAGVGPFFADTVQPLLVLDAAGTGAHDGLFVDTVDGPDLLNGHLCSSSADACKGAIVWQMSNPIAHDGGGTAPSLSGTYLPDTKPFTFPPAADQPSCNRCVDADDLRIPATPILRNGTIYAAWGTGINNGTQVVPGIEWAQIPTDKNKFSITTGYFNFTGDTAATYPALMPDGAGNVVMLYERMGSTVFPETRYVVREQTQKNFPDAGQLLKAGEASYRPTLCGTTALPVCRWGDFEATSFDGAGRIWVAGEYANTHTDPAVAPWFGRNWGTWIGAVDVAPGG